MGDRRAVGADDHASEPGADHATLKVLEVPTVAEREQIRKNAPTRTDDTDVDDLAPSEAGSRIKAELDDLLDEIDDVLETNAEDFVKSYIQKGGE